MRTTVLMTVIAAALLMVMVGCNKSDKQVKSEIPTLEELMGTWIYAEEYEKVDGEWVKMPEITTLKTQSNIFGPDGHFITAYTYVNQDVKTGDCSWKMDAQTGDLTLAGVQSGRICGIDSNDMLAICSDARYNPDAGKIEEGEFLNKYTRALPANRRFVGFWEYVATYRKDGEREGYYTWTEYKLNVPERTVLENTADGRVFRINTYNGETRKDEGASFNIDSKTGEYVVRDKHLGRIVFLDDNNIRWYQDKVTDAFNGEVTEGKFYMHFKRVTE